jgi:hypothetical protein
MRALFKRCQHWRFTGCNRRRILIHAVDKVFKGPQSQRQFKILALSANSRAARVLRSCWVVYPHQTNHFARHPEDAYKVFADHYAARNVSTEPGRTPLKNSLYLRCGGALPPGVLLKDLTTGRVRITEQSCLGLMRSDKTRQSGESRRSAWWATAPAASDVSVYFKSVSGCLKQVDFPRGQIRRYRQGR